MFGTRYFSKRIEYYIYMYIQINKYLLHFVPMHIFLCGEVLLYFIV
jgi:hypothetical protein